MKNYKPTHSHTHFAIRTSQHSNPKLQKSMSLPTLKKMLTKFEMNRKKLIKHESTTKAISNAGTSDKIENNE